MQSIQKFARHKFKIISLKNPPSQLDDQLFPSKLNFFDLVVLLTTQKLKEKKCQFHSLGLNIEFCVVALAEIERFLNFSVFRVWYESFTTISEISLTLNRQYPKVQQDAKYQSKLSSLSPWQRNDTPSSLQNPLLTIHQFTQIRPHGIGVVRGWANSTVALGC